MVGDGGDYDGNYEVDDDDSYDDNYNDDNEEDIGKVEAIDEG